MRPAPPPEVPVATGHSRAECTLRWRLLVVAFPLPFAALAIPKILDLESTAIELLVIGTVLLFLLATYGRTSLRCPRCGEPVYGSTWRSNTFAKRYLNCGLRRGDGEYGAVGLATRPASLGPAAE